MATISRANCYHVPKKQWDKWSAEARELFNYTYSMMRSNQRLFLHPKAEGATRKHWDTTAWNAAWTVADYRYDQERAMRDAAARGAKVPQ
jgi:hypothetical protein